MTSRAHPRLQASITRRELAGSSLALLATLGLLPFMRQDEATAGNRRRRKRKAREGSANVSIPGAAGSSGIPGAGRPTNTPRVDSIPIGSGSSTTGSSTNGTGGTGTGGSGGSSGTANGGTGGSGTGGTSGTSGGGTGGTSGTGGSSGSGTGGGSGDTGSGTGGGSGESGGTGTS